ncbi:MAG: RNA-binding S4 domain-containing protein [Candidatus Omnitrophota bacterium]
MTFELRGDSIDLDNLLKAAGAVSSGTEAGELIRQGLVSVNGEKESRVRRKIRKGDCVEVHGDRIEVVS